MQQRPVIWMKISGVCGILAPLVAFTSVSLSILSAPQFTLTNNALSNLGIIPGATSAIFNYGLITSGILGLIFSASIYRAVHFYEIHSAIGKSRLINRALGGVLFFPGACFALIAIGIFPQTNWLHNIAAVAFFVFSICVLGNFTVGFWQVNQRSLAWFTFILSVIFVVPWLLLLVPYVSGLALPELISALAISLWMAVFGYKIIKIESRPESPSLSENNT